MNTARHHVKIDVVVKIWLRNFMDSDAQNNLVYFLENKMYINITNLCTNDCAFCIRGLKDDVQGSNLWLKNETSTAENIIQQLKEKNIEEQKEVVFCGYGEPLIQLDKLIKVSEFIKTNYPQIKIRINTNGHANLIHKRNIVPEIKNLIDSISVSLNAENAELYYEISKPNINFPKEEIYQAVKDFIAECVKSGIDTSASVVSGYKHFNIDINKCKEITENLGAKFRNREWLNQGYN